MTLEESREIIPLMESMIGQIEEQQTLMAEMILEMQNRDTQLSLMQEQNQKLQKIKQRVIRAAQHFAKYRGTAFQDGRTENEDRTFGKRKSAMAEIGTETEQRKQFITETEHRIAELEQQIEKGRDIDERIQRIKERRTVGRTSPLDRGDTRRTGTERPAYRGTKDAAQRISDLEREIKQREQSREYSSICIKERLETSRQSIAEREEAAEAQAFVTIGECQDKIRCLTQQRSYARTHQKIVEILVKSRYMKKCEACDRTNYQKYQKLKIRNTKNDNLWEATKNGCSKQPCSLLAWIR